MEYRPLSLPSKPCYLNNGYPSSRPPTTPSYLRRTERCLQIPSLKTVPEFTSCIPVLLHWSAVISSLFSQASLLIYLFCWVSGGGTVCMIGGLSLKICCLLSWAPLPFRAASHGILPTGSLNKPESVSQNPGSGFCCSFSSYTLSWTWLFPGHYHCGNHWLSHVKTFLSPVWLIKAELLHLLFSLKMRWLTTWK